MADSREDFGADWVHGVFGVFREEMISIAADFGQRVKGEIDLVADATGMHPPSATALLTAVALETSNMAGGLFKVADQSDAHEDPDAPAREPDNDDED